MDPIDLSVLDWEDRIRTGRSLIPAAARRINPKLWQRAVGIFDKLCLPDVPGNPPMAEACGEWFREIVGALLGAIDPENAVRIIRELLLLAPKKSSKALALDTLIATPTGFTTMAKIAVGDHVLDSDGRATRVIAKSQVFIGRPSFEVEFSTGEIVVCDSDHLWVTDAHRDRDRQWPGPRSIPRPSTKTTAQIAASLKVKSGRYVINNHRTALSAALDLPEASLPIPPYALGVWLGDGAAAGALVTSGCNEADDLVERLVANGQPAYVRARYPAKGSATITLGIPSTRTQKLVYRFRREAVRLGLLGNKHIPPVYLRASRDQRLALLRGLMDTDGNITIRGECIYATTLPRLRDDVRELIASMGFKPTVSEARAVVNGKDCGPYWRVRFAAYSELAVSMMPRKAGRQKRKPACAARSQSRQIVDVRQVPSVPVQCIAVESATKQFLLTRSLIPTHNTTYGAGLMLTALLMNKRPRAEFLFIAPTQLISDLAFDAASGMVDIDPDGFLQKRLKVQAHLKWITNRRTRAVLKVKTFHLKVLTGIKPAGVLLDELHEISKSSTASRIIGQIRGGLHPYPEGFFAMISTQSDDPPAGAFKAELHMARGVRDGRVKAAMMPVLYEFPKAIVTDKAKPPAWQDPGIWPMVTPNLGRSVTIPRLVEDFATAKEKGDEEIRRWASQHLNIEIGLALATDRWAGADYWEMRADPTLTIDTLLDRSEVLVLGIDGGGLEDMLGLNVLGRDKRTRQWLSWSRAWLFEGVLKKYQTEAARLRDFESQGDLVIVPSPGEDVAQLADLVRRFYDSGLFPLGDDGMEKPAIGVDPARIGTVVDEIVAREMPSEIIGGISQGYRLSGAIDTAERKLADGSLIHAPQDLMNWCVGNCKIEIHGNAVYITKQAAGRAKIDPVLALMDSIALMSMNPQAAGEPEAVYIGVG